MARPTTRKAPKPKAKSPPKKRKEQVPGTRNSTKTHKSIVAASREQAALSGMLPHEWLLKVMRGEGIEQRYWEVTRDKKGNEINRTLKMQVVYPMFSERMDAAKSAAPFFAARLATQIIAIPNPNEAGAAFAGFDLAGLSEQELSTVKKVLMSAALRGMKGGNGAG